MQTGQWHVQSRSSPRLMAIPGREGGKERGREERRKKGKLGGDRERGREGLRFSFLGSCIPTCSVYSQDLTGKTNYLETGGCNGGWGEARLLSGGNANKRLKAKVDISFQEPPSRTS